MTARAYTAAILSGFALLAVALLGLRWAALTDTPALATAAGVLPVQAGYAPPKGRSSKSEGNSNGAQQDSAGKSGRGVSPSAKPQPKSDTADAPDSRTKELPAPRSINVNTADSAELQRLPGIGPALAQRIIEHRAQHGPFRGIAQLTDVKGIGPKKLEALSNYVRCD